MVSVPQPGSEPFDQRVTTLAALIRNVWREILKSFAGTITPHSGITLSDANYVRTKWMTTEINVVLGHLANTYMSGAGLIAEATGDEDHDELIGDDLVQVYLSKARNRLLPLGNDVWKDVRTQLQMSLNAGEDVKNIAKQVATVAGVSQKRALTIARTEIHTAYEAGAYEQAKFVGGGTKTWIATKDIKTRKAHKDANGQTVAIDDMFIVDELPLRFPGDPLGDLDNSVNCRCSVAYDFADVSTGNDGASSALTLFDESPDVIIAAAGKWKPSQHPRGSDGKFIRKGAVSTLLSKGKPNIYDVIDAMVELDADSWSNLTKAQQTYIGESVEKLPPQMQANAKKIFANEVGQSLDSALTSTPVTSAPKTTPGPKTSKVTPNLAGALKNATAGQVIATGTKNGKKFRVTANKATVSDWNPDGTFRLEFVKNDGTPSAVGAKSGDAYTITSTLMGKPGTKLAWDVPDGVHYAIADVLDNVGKPDLGGNNSFAGNTKIEKAWKAVGEGHWDSLTPDQQKTLVDVTFRNDNQNKITSASKKIAEEHQAKLIATPPPVAEVDTSSKAYNQNLWNKGLISTEEFHQAIGEYPEGSEMKAAKAKPSLNDINLKAYLTGDVIAKSSNGDTIEKSGSTSVALLDKDGGFVNSLVVSPYDSLEDFALSESGENQTWSVVPPGGGFSPAPKPVPSVQTKIPDGLKGKPGDPAKATTTVIWGKHPPGTTILENPDGSEFVRWNGKKYEHVVDGFTQSTWTKKDAYANLKADTHWVVPGGKAAPKSFYATPPPEVLPELTELPPLDGETYKSGQSLSLMEGKKYLIDTVHPPGTVVGISATKTERLVATNKPDSLGKKMTYRREIKHPTTGEWHVVDVGITGIGAIQLLRGAPNSSAEKNWLIPNSAFNPSSSSELTVNTSPVDLSGYKKLTGQKGSNPGGVYEDPAGTKLYVKKAKTEQHAANEIAASALYNLAGISTPQVFAATNAPDLGGGLQTATTLVPNAKSDLALMIKSPTYVEMIREGFAVDAWLANWDVAGLSFDNIVTGVDGKPHRIDVGGTMLYRAQGAPKGAAFGDKVNEIDTLRSPSMNPQSAKIFSGMTDADVAKSVERVAAISESDIDQVVKQAGLPASVAQTLKNRRQDLITRFLPKQVDEDLVLLDEDYVAPTLVPKKFLGKKVTSAKKTTPAAEALQTEVKQSLDEETKQFLLNEAATSTLSYNEAIDLVNMIDANDMSGLSVPQKDSITTTLVDAHNLDVPGASEAILKWDALKKVDPSTPSQETTLPDQPKLTGTPMNANNFAAVALDIADYKNNDVIAVSDDGKARVVYDEIGMSFQVSKLTDGGDSSNSDDWTVDSVYHPLDDAGELDEGQIDALLSDNSEFIWLKPTQGDVKPPDVIAYSHESVIEVWSGVLKTSVTPGTVVAVTPDGKYELQRISAGWVINDVSGVDKKQLMALPDYGVPQDVLDELSETWIVPTKKPVKPENIANSTISTKVVFGAGLVAGKNNEVIVEGTIATVPHAKYRVQVETDGGKKVLSLQLKNVKTNSPWVEINSYSSYDAFVAEWPHDPFIWSSTIDDQPELTTSVPGSFNDDVPTPPLPSTSAPTPVVSTPTPSSGPVPYYQIPSLKQIMKSKGKVGYWSKPEKIWDVIKEFQTLYADPNNPGHSKYTPVQVLAALDSTTNTQTDPTPYTSKINKWAGTAKGTAYIAKSLGSTNSTKTTDKPTVDHNNPVPVGQTPTDVYQKVANGDYPSGVVLYSGTNEWDSPIRVVVKPGNIAAYQYKKVDDGGWGTISYVNGAAELEHIVSTNSMKYSGAISSTSAMPNSPNAIDLGIGDIGHLSDTTKQSLYDTFKQQPSTYLSSPQKNVYAALKTIGDTQGYSVLQMLKVIDDVGAKKVNKPNELLFEKKIIAWLKSPQGAAIASGQGVPKPPRPAFKGTIDPNKTVPSFESSSAHEYKVLSVISATAWYDQVKATHGEWTASERAALKTYTGGSYMAMNPYLWGDLDSVSDTHAKAIKNAQLGMRPSLQPVLLHRGSGYAGIGVKDYDGAKKIVGQTWKSDGFVSTSVGGSAAFSGPVLMEIEAPPGTPMAYVKPISSHSSENEMLLAAGLSFRIVSVKKIGHQTIVRMRVVPDPTPAGGAA